MTLLQVKRDNEYYPVKYSRHELPRFDKGGFDGDYPYPAVFPVSTSPAGGQQIVVKLTPEWWNFIIKINGGAKNFEAMGGNAPGINPWLLRGPNKYWREKGEGVPIDPRKWGNNPPKMSVVVMSDNVVRQIGTKGNGAEIDAFHINDTPPKDADFPNDPRFIKGHSVAQDGSIGNAPKGYHFITPILVDVPHAYVDKKLLRAIKYTETGIIKEKPMTLAINQGWAQGPDISKWDVAFDPKKSEHRIDFAIIKAGEGTSIDPRFRQHLDESRALPVVGAYWYYRSGVPWNEQSGRFMDVAIGSGVNFLCLDYETINNKLSGGTDGDAFSIIEAVSSFDENVFLYTNRATYNDMMARGATWLKETRLWISQWYEENWFYEHATGPRMPTGRADWSLWQWGGDYRDPSGWVVPGYKEAAEWGISGKDSVDLNYYRGTLEQMMQDLNVQPKEAPRPSTIPVTEEWWWGRLPDWMKRSLNRK